MARGACTFRIRDLTRAIKAARAGGLDVRQVRIANDGTIMMGTDALPLGTANATDATDKPDDLDRELEEWGKRHAS